MPTSKRSSKPRSKCGKESERGAALVEFALIACMMMVILAGIVDYALFLQAAFQVQEAAAAAAQYAAIPGNQDMSVPATQTATQNWAIQAATSTTTAGVTNFQATAINTWKCAATGSNVTYSTSCTNGTPVEFVQVTTQGTFTSVLQFPGLPTTLTLHGIAIYPVPWTQPAG